MRSNQFSTSDFQDQQEKHQNWFYQYRPRFESRRFWTVQVIVLIVAAVHDFVEVTGILPYLGPLYFLPISIFIFPVIYAALNFGLVGSLATVLWIIVVTIPNWVLFHYGLQRIGVIFQMMLFVTVAFFVGQRVDREANARRAAEIARSQLKSYMSHQVETEEKERQHIARELHDTTIQNVVFLGRQLDAVLDRETLPPSTIEKLQAARNVSDQVITNLRDFASDLRPPALDDLGLLSSISKLLLNFTDRTGIKSYLNSMGEERRFLPDVEVGLYRIVQEALQNVERHSQAKKVTVTLDFRFREAEMQIKDDGIGFDINSAGKIPDGTQHFGLMGMQERAELFGGKFDIYSGPMRGTAVSISIPA